MWSSDLAHSGAKVAFLMTRASGNVKTQPVSHGGWRLGDAPGLCAKQTNVGAVHKL